MKNNKGYLVIIFVLLAAIVFLVFLLFVADSGKYCVPLIKEKTQIPVNAVGNDSLKTKDSVNSE